MLIDITQEVFSCRVFPGDPAPERRRLCELDKGDACELTVFSMCAHNGTHVDAPAHFIPGGKTVDELGLAPFIGPCFVWRGEGAVSAAEALAILGEARAAGAGERLLLAGPVTVTEEAARVFAAGGLLLLGNESQTVGPEDAPRETHRILLGAGVALLEGVVLTDVRAGRYLLSCAPLNLGGCEGAPCRAYLADDR